MEIERAAVVGAGTMGAEIALTMSLAGLPVLLRDVVPDVLARAQTAQEEICRRLVERGRLTERDKQHALDRIKVTLSYEGFESVDVVIEAAPERMAIKREIYRHLDEVCPPRTILASKTSSLSISALATSTTRADHVAGLHFFNPASRMRLVEIVPGLKTAPKVTKALLALVDRLGKQPVVVKECPGFVVNRVLLPYLNEAIYVLEEGEHSATAIDGAAIAWGMPMGPLALIDMIGLDVVLQIGNVLRGAYGERMSPAGRLRQMVASGHLGRKSGRGFYRYPRKERAPSTTERESAGLAERLMMPLINESARCVQEGIASISDVDLAVKTGTGMKRDGNPMGPLAAADAIGLDHVLGTLERLTQEQAPRFWPCWSLRLLVGAGHLGKTTGGGYYQYPRAPAGVEGPKIA